MHFLNCLLICVLVTLLHVKIPYPPVIGKIQVHKKILSYIIVTIFHMWTQREFLYVMLWKEQH